jgi:hypothetical protein
MSKLKFLILKIMIFKIIKKVLINWKNNHHMDFLFLNWINHPLNLLKLHLIILLKNKRIITHNRIMINKWQKINYQVNNKIKYLNIRNRKMIEI